MDKEIARLVRKYKTNCPFEIASSLGIQIRYKDLGKVTKGIYIRKLRRRFIIIHEDLSEFWIRFIMAHELGHDRLHRGYGFYFIEEKTFFNSGKFEREANQFAVKLLLYGSKIEPGMTKEQYFAKNNIPIEMSKYFNV